MNHKLTLCFRSFWWNKRLLHSRKSSTAQRLSINLQQRQITDPEIGLDLYLVLRNPSRFCIFFIHFPQKVTLQWYFCFRFFFPFHKQIKKLKWIEVRCWLQEEGGCAMMRDEWRGRHEGFNTGGRHECKID